MLLKPLGHLSKTYELPTSAGITLDIQAVKAERHRHFGAAVSRPSTWSGQGGIRTPDTLACITVFETAAFDHSATCPWKYFTTVPQACHGGRSLAGLFKGTIGQD